MKRYSILFLLMFVFSAAHAQEWIARYNGSGNSYDMGNALFVDDSGFVYITGGVTDTYSFANYVTIKYDGEGNEVWVVQYDGPAGEDDEAMSIAVDDSGYVYITGISPGIGTDTDIATIKYDKDGNEIWVRRFNGPGNGWDYGWDLVLDDSSNVYVSGMSVGESTMPDFITIKYDKDGNEIWAVRYSGVGLYNLGGYRIILDSLKNVYVTGASYGINTDRDYATVKYDRYGNELWAARYNGPGNFWDTPVDLAVDDSGNVYVTGYSFGNHFDWATIKYDSSGNELWVKRFDGPAHGVDNAYALIMDDTSNIYVAGTITDNVTGKDAAIIKYDRNGNQLWTRTYNGSANGYDRFRTITMDDSGEIYVAGTSEAVTTHLDYIIIKYNTSGDTIRTLRYNGPGNGTDEVMDICVDRAMNIYVTGYSDGGSSLNDIATIKYSQQSRIVEKTRWSYKPLITLKVFPNPFVDYTKIVLQTPNGDPVSVEIFDIQGRKIKTLPNQNADGFLTYIWDGKDSKGKTVSGGCYMLKVENEKITYSKKIIKIRR